MAWVPSRSVGERFTFGRTRSFAVSRVWCGLELLHDVVITRNESLIELWEPSALVSPSGEIVNNESLCQDRVDEFYAALDAEVRSGFFFRFTADLDTAVVPAGNTGPDSDGDGMSDECELDFGTSPSSPDTDGDGTTDIDEIMLGTDPGMPHGLNGTLNLRRGGEDAHCDITWALTGTPYTGACEGCTWAFNLSKSTRYDDDYVSPGRPCDTSGNVKVDVATRLEADVDFDYLLVGTPGYYYWEDWFARTRHEVLFHADLSLH